MTGEPEGVQWADTPGLHGVLLQSREVVALTGTTEKADVS